MGVKILLNSNNGVYSVDEKDALQIELLSSVKPIKTENINASFSLYEQYNAERDACNVYRFIFNVDTICSNVLFNMQTEVVQFEGSNSATVITDETVLDRSEVKRSDTFEFDNCIQNETTINRTQAIRDTEYSHPKNGGFEYHCGVDIFNNHLLRKNGFVHVNKFNNSDTLSPFVYNTIKDYCRDGNGDVITLPIMPRYDMTNKTKLHLYTLDNCKNIKDAFKDNLLEQDGWLGFSNPSTIDIPNNSGNSVTINKMFENREACEFIDMYPDRTLYSFIPKYNKYRKRQEKNWDYCITYPYKIDYNMFNKVCGSENNSIKSSCYSGTQFSSVEVIFCKSFFKHNLKPNDFISVYYYKKMDNDELKFFKFPLNVKVVEIGNNDGEDVEFIFAVKKEDILEIVEDVLDNGLFFKRLSNGIECSYYFRKYKKLKKFDEHGNRTLDIESEVNKAAYSKNIYNDNIAQVIFTDDIDVSDLYDHMGRPVSELYFTVVKRNQGRLRWHGNHPSYNTRDIEYSHCFGKVTSGLYLGVNDLDKFDYNIRYLHNISTWQTSVGWTDVDDSVDMDAIEEVVENNTIKSARPNKGNTILGDGNENDYIFGLDFALSAFGTTILSGTPKTIENDINITFDEFYGDVVEFDKYNFIETELTPVLHRFNTAQREWCIDTRYSPMIYDKIKSDDYDLDENGNAKPFTVQTVDMSLVKYEENGYKLLGNVRPEGYYYNPHTKIQIRENNDLATRIAAKIINFINVSGYYSPIERKTKISFDFPVNYGFFNHGLLCLYDCGGVFNGVAEQQRTLWGEIINVNGNRLTLEFNGDVCFTVNHLSSVASEMEPSSGTQRYFVYWTDTSIPSYAIFLPQVSSFVWRGITPPSQITTDMELFNTPFANGRFYIEDKLTMFVRRQDPDGRFGLLYAKNPILKSPIDFFALEGTTMDLSQVVDFYNNILNVCY